MPRSKYDYSQSVIGTCGHICAIWPQVSELGGKNPEVYCETCTRDRYGIPYGENIGVWVRIEEKEPPSKPAKKTPAKREPRKKSVKCSICSESGHVYTDCPLLQGGLFDA